MYVVCYIKFYDCVFIRSSFIHSWIDPYPTFKIALLVNEFSMYPRPFQQVTKQFRIQLHKKLR